jgi:lysyl-tRNA synthetase class 2
MDDGELHRLVKQRLEKADELRKSGRHPYANDFRPELTCAEFSARYGEGTREDLENVKRISTVAGRVMAMRSMGKATFLSVRDRSGDLQILVQKDRVGEEAYATLKLTDLGDIIGVAGTPLRTKTGELSIGADGFRVLTKSIRPLPDKFHGVQDTEIRYRQRYVDLIMNPTVREIFKSRTKIIRGIQKFLDARDFMEVETPVLADEAGGATARPFKTHHNALGQDFFMRIATELHLKRLVVGGIERVYEIGRLFRNEGVSTRHNPEFTTIEFYQAYATYTDLMDLVEEMLSSLVIELHGTHVISFGDRKVDFTPPFRRASIATLVGEHLGVDGDLRRIEGVERALAIVSGHTVTADTPLLIVLRELSDDEAMRLVPGIDKSATGESVVERAKRALRAGSPDFYARLGRAIDEEFTTVGTSVAEIGSVDDDTGELGEERTNPGLNINALRQAAMSDPLRERRRRLALHLLYAVFDHEVESTLVNPTFITDFSVSESPLARRRDSDPAVVDRFELIAAGMEVANAFSELNDPLDQKQRFLDQMREKERGDVEAHGLDEDFVRALEYGMPPTAGCGIGIDRLTMLLTNSTSIREVILFPAMRRQSMTAHEGPSDDNAAALDGKR